jgi:hypothetical protein
MSYPGNRAYLQNIRTKTFHALLLTQNRNGTTYRIKKHTTIDNYYTDKKRNLNFIVPITILAVPQENPPPGESMPQARKSCKSQQSGVYSQSHQYVSTVYGRA